MLIRSFCNKNQHYTASKVDFFSFTERVAFFKSIFLLHELTKQFKYYPKIIQLPNQNVLYVLEKYGEVSSRSNPWFSCKWFFLSVNLIKVTATHTPDSVQLYFNFRYKGGCSNSEAKLWTSQNHRKVGQKGPLEVMQSNFSLKADEYQH